MFRRWITAAAVFGMVVAPALEVSAGPFGGGGGGRSGGGFSGGGGGNFGGAVRSGASSFGGAVRSSVGSLGSRAPTPSFNRGGSGFSRPTTNLGSNFAPSVNNFRQNASNFVQRAAPSGGSRPTIVNRPPTGTAPTANRLPSVANRLPSVANRLPGTSSGGAASTPRPSSSAPRPSSSAPSFATRFNSGTLGTTSRPMLTPNRPTIGSGLNTPRPNALPNLPNLASIRSGVSSTPGTTPTVGAGPTLNNLRTRATSAASFAGRYANAWRNGLTAPTPGGSAPGNGTPGTGNTGNWRNWASNWIRGGSGTPGTPGTPGAPGHGGPSRPYYPGNVYRPGTGYNPAANWYPGGYGYGGYPYGGYGGGYGYGGNPYGYGYGYPWGLVASIITRGLAVLPWGYGGYGYGGYGGGYGYASSYSSSPTYVTNVTNVTEEPQPEPVPEQPATLPASDYATLGEAAFRAGDYADAVRQWQHALVDDPRNATLALMIGQALFAQGKYDEAAGAIQTAMQSMPVEQWNVVVAHAGELYGSPGTYADQVFVLEKAAAQSPSPDKLFLLGYHHGYLGDTARAVQELEQGAKLAPQDAVMRQLRDVFQARLSASTAPKTEL